MELGLVFRVRKECHLVLVWQYCMQATQFYGLGPHNCGGAGKSGTCRVDQQAKDPGENFSCSSKAVHRQNSFLVFRARGRAPKEEAPHPHLAGTGVMTF